MRLLLALQSVLGAPAVGAGGAPSTPVFWLLNIYPPSSRCAALLCERLEAALEPPQSAVSSSWPCFVQTLLRTVIHPQRQSGAALRDSGRRFRPGSSLILAVQGSCPPAADAGQPLGSTRAATARMLCRLYGPRGRESALVRVDGHLRVEAIAPNSVRDSQPPGASGRARPLPAGAE
jgi:hypothetical protein